MRHANKAFSAIEDDISIHAPTRGATCDDNNTGAGFNAFQSTHPRGVRPLRAKRPQNLSRISIHAPTRGATNYVLESLKARIISIHAPTRGATGVYPRRN